MYIPINISSTPKLKKENLRAFAVLTFGFQTYIDIKHICAQIQDKRRLHISSNLFLARRNSRKLRFCTKMKRENVGIIHEKEALKILSIQCNYDRSTAHTHIAHRTFSLMKFVYIFVHINLPGKMVCSFLSLSPPTHFIPYRWKGEKVDIFDICFYV